MVPAWLATKLEGERLSVLAAERVRNQPALYDIWLIWRQYLLLLGFILIAILVLYFFMRWLRRDRSDRRSASDQLSDFRALYEQGQISREEFDRLRNVLGERMRREVEGSGAAPAAPEQRPATAQTPQQAEPPAPESRNGPQQS